MDKIPQTTSASSTSWTKWLLPCLTGLLAPLIMWSVGVRADQPISLKVVGGLAGVSQYERLERPFWEHDIEKLSGGRIKAEIHSFDRSGLPGQEMLQLMRLGVVPFGTALLAVVSADEPELNLVDLPALNPDIQTLRKTVSAYRPHLQNILESKFHIKLLAVYAYPAQVLFCTQKFSGLSGLAGRKVRTSSVGQSELMTSVGALPVLTPFSEVVSAIRNGVVDCAITGTLSGNEIGLSNVTSYVYPMAISWGLSIFAVNQKAWDALPADLRPTIESGLKGLERKVWDAAERETDQGLACDIGEPGCPAGHTPGHMTLVPVTPGDEIRRKQLLIDSVLPNWIQRCGAACLAAWNESLGPVLGISLPDRK